MNLKNTLLGLVTLAGTVTTPALAGYQYDGVYLMDGSDFTGNEVVATEMINNLNEMGIPVVDGGKNDLPMCESRENSILLGAYAPGPNIMIICSDHGRKDLMFETLVHETVHVIQDARDGLENDTLGEGNDEYLNRLVSDLDPRKADNIVALYDQSDYAVEIEAFYFEDKAETVSNELNRWAF